MSLSDRNKRFELTEGTPSADRPKIWVEGRQGPKFDLRAYVATSYGMAKRDLLPEMLDAEGRLRGLGHRVAGGNVRINLAWAGRAQRLLPSQGRVGGWVLAWAKLFADTRLIIAPEEVSEVELAYPNLIRMAKPVVVAKVVPMRPVAREATEPTLHAIRSAISAAPHDASLDQREKRVGPSTAADADPAGDTAGELFGKAKLALWSLACRFLFGILIIFAIPAGAMKALLFHLDGGDLTDWS